MPTLAALLAEQPYFCVAPAGVSPWQSTAPSTVCMGVARPADSASSESTCAGPLQQASQPHAAPAHDPGIVPSAPALQGTVPGWARAAPAGCRSGRAQDWTELQVALRHAVEAMLEAARVRKPSSKRGRARASRHAADDRPPATRRVVNCSGSAATAETASPSGVAEAGRREVLHSSLCACPSPEWRCCLSPELRWPSSCPADSESDVEISSEPEEVVDRRLALWLAKGNSETTDATSCEGGPSQGLLSPEELRSTAGALQWSLEAQQAVWTSQITQELTEFLRGSLAQEKVPQGGLAPTRAFAHRRKGGESCLCCHSHQCDVIVAEVPQRAVLS